MGLRQRIISEVYDEQTDKVINREIINDKEIKKPQSIEDLGYNHKAQIDMLHNIQEAFLFIQASLITPEACAVCGDKTRKAGHTSSNFHSVYTDHEIKIPRKLCCNPKCQKRTYDSVHSVFGSNMHPDLVEKQVKTGSQNSFMNSQLSLEGENGRYRKINNQLTIKKTVDKVGKILDTLHQSSTAIDVVPAKKLIVQVDGGYIKSKDPNQGSFEVLLSHVYNPENHEHGGLSKSGTRKSGAISNKIYSASSLKDRGKSIRLMTTIAAQKQGMTANTEVTALSDGAKNCWSTIKVLEKKCKSIEYILDWYHIKQKFSILYNQLEDPYASELESIQWNIWHGDSDKALKRLTAMYLELLGSEFADKLHDLLKYLTNNKRYLINYEKRKEKSLPFTSSIIESAVETVINDRHKKKHKAQWTRQGAHNVLQIRTSIKSQQWNDEWSQAKKLFYKQVA